MDSQLLESPLAVATLPSEWSLALLLFEEATQQRCTDLTAYSSAMHACKQAHLWQEGISLLVALRGERLQADASTLAAAAGACERSKQWQQALCLLRQARGAWLGDEI